MRDDELRRRCVCASEMPAIVGLDPYGHRPFSVYLQKMGLVEPPRETPELRWGRLIEGACLQAYMDDTARVISPIDTTRHGTVPFLAGTPDGVFGSTKVNGGVEVKTVGFRYAHHWLDGVPPYVHVQVAIYMSIFDVPEWDVGRLILATRDWKIETVRRDLVLEELLIDAARHFYEYHMVPQVPPLMDGGPGVAQYLQRKYPGHSDQMLDASLYPWILPAVREYFDARDRKALEQHVMEINSAVIKDCIGDRLGIKGDGWYMSWKADTHGHRRFSARREDDRAGQ